MLWGVEDRWAQVLGTRYAAAQLEPTWSSAVFDASAFRSFERAALARVAPIASSSSGSGGSSWSGSGGASSSGGSSGGGFSGGGGGGGGGGGR